jgi:hypothetical protein
MTDEQWVPGDKSELMSAIEREWNLLLDVVAKIEKAGKMTTPDEGGWSPKDNLAHLTDWVNILMEYHMDRRPNYKIMGVSAEEVTEQLDIDTGNSLLFERNKHRSTQDVLDGLKRAHDKLLAKLDTMSFDDLLKPRLEEDPEKRPLLLWVLGDTTEHFAEHRETLKKML